MLIRPAGPAISAPTPRPFPGRPEGHAAIPARQQREQEAALPPQPRPANPIHPTAVRFPRAPGNPACARASGHCRASRLRCARTWASSRGPDAASVCPACRRAGRGRLRARYGRRRRCACRGDPRDGFVIVESYERNRPVAHCHIRRPCGPALAARCRSWLATAGRSRVTALESYRDRRLIRRGTRARMSALTVR